MYKSQVSCFLIHPFCPSFPTSLAVQWLRLHASNAGGNYICNSLKHSHCKRIKKHRAKPSGPFFTLPSSPPPVLELTLLPSPIPRDNHNYHLDVYSSPIKSKVSSLLCLSCCFKKKETGKSKGKVGLGNR